MPNVNEETSVVFANLIEKDGSMILDEDNSSVLGYREFGVFENKSNKVTLGYRFAETVAHDRCTEVGETAICDNDEVGEE